MKVLIISDGHGNVDILDRLEPVAKDADFILYGGDFARYGKPETGKPFLDRLARVHDRIFAVTGNCDEPLFRDAIEDCDISIEGSLSYYSGLVLAGSGGGSKFTGTTPNERSDEELVGDLRLVEESAGSSGDGGAWDNLIIVTHNPPAGTKLDVAASGVHVGSPLIRAFIERHKPLLAVSGHIHESAAIDTLGRTTLVNPGPLLEGKYAIAEIAGGGASPFSVAGVAFHSL